MVRVQPQQPVPLIRGCYLDVLEGIMAEHGIPPQRNPSPTVPADATFAEAVQNTDWFCWRGDNRPLYRYRRYREVLGATRPSGRRVAHVDIGCGAGLFSWVFLDWVRENNLAYENYENVVLYGLDHSPEMVRLAQQMRAGLMTNIPNYPELRYTHRVDALLQLLTEHHRPATDYTVTFGHVLVQAPGAISEFARVIAHIVQLLDEQSSCAVLAVDARGESSQLAQRWIGLLDRLSRLRIQHQQVAVRFTLINNSSDAKIVRLSRERR